MGPATAQSTLQVLGVETIGNGTLAQITLSGTTSTISATDALNILVTNSFKIALNSIAILNVNNSGGVTLAGATAGSQLTVGGGALNAGIVGVTVQAGSSSSDLNTVWNNRTGTLLAQVFGDGGFTLGTASDKGYGTINVQNGVYKAGVPVGQPIFLQEDFSNDDGMCFPVPINFGPMNILSIVQNCPYIVGQVILGAQFCPITDLMCFGVNAILCCLLVGPASTSCYLSVFGNGASQLGWP